jgi:dienelactone hydrolase
MPDKRRPGPAGSSGFMPTEDHDSMRIAACLSVVALSFTVAALGDGAADNVPVNVRRIPALGIEVKADDKTELESGLTALDASIGKLKEREFRDGKVKDRLPDVQIYAKAVRDALTYREFFDPKDVVKAKALVKKGQARADALLAGQAPWEDETGLVVRGYVSKIDGSVQPYGLVIPPSYTHRTAGRYRVDLWFHGRGETLSEVNFLDERQRQAGAFRPTDTIVLHPYGRYCNAAKFAGEVDALEALESVERRYRVDVNRVSVRGFSMGGASAWQFAVHYPDRWFAANPGAGFAETPQFLNVFQKETLAPTWYEEKLWSLYDCDRVVANLRNVPTIAYSGELDTQKQAADVMAVALLREGIELTHIIGPKTKHAYHPEAAREVESRMATLADKGRNTAPREVHLQTYTLKYQTVNWVTIDAMAEHWSESRIDARLADPVVTPGAVQIEIETKGVTAFTLDFPANTAWFRPEPLGRISMSINGQSAFGPKPRSDGSWRTHWIKNDKGWVEVAGAPFGLVKRHNLQGPIDDAFMDSFIIVRPTGKARSEKFAAWSKAEMDRAIEHWRRHFRGEARVKDDTAITDADIAGSNLILGGDSESNAVLKRIGDQLPVGWRDGKIVVGDRSFPADDHALIAIYPNPMNINRYVVLNSGFTFREYDYLNNARQVPKLPDWAVIDLKTPPNPRYPGKVVDADFFGERWEVRPAHAAH